jgi:hypothetical protein
MYEAIPVVAGLVIGFFASRMVDTRLRNVIIAVLSVVIGTFVSVVIAGEEWFFIPFDIFQVAFASAVAILLVKRYIRAENR